MSGFVHLHTHSRFSFMDGAADLDALVDKAAAYGMPALALTDHQGLYGAIRFYQKCLKAGIKPIIGAEVTVAALGLEASLDDALTPGPDVGFGRARGRGFHLTLLAEDIGGYRNLCRLLSRAHVRSGDAPSQVTARDLGEFASGLICLSGCPDSEVGMAVRTGHLSRAQRVLARLAHLFGAENTYVEVMNLLAPDSPRYVAGLVETATDMGLPLVATNDVHYVERQDFRIHDVLASAGVREALPGPYERINAELWLKPAARMRTLFKDLERACDTTLEIAARCNLDLGLGEYHFPAARVPAGETASSVLSKVSWDGLKRRYTPMPPAAAQRLKRELALVDEMGLSEYFLICKEIVDFARKRDIRYSGRGSAGNSIITYALDITDADPVAHDLLFERFLNPRRRNMPDIDIDFDSARRDEVIDFIYEHFGREHVAMVATVNTMSAKGAVRTVARAFGLPIDEVNMLSHGLPWAGASRIREVLETYPECRNHPLREKRYEYMLDLIEELDDCPMHLGTHLGGLLITREPIDTWMPLQWAAKGVVVSQYDKDDVEAMGLLKMDILGLRMHSAITDTVMLARERVGEEAVPEPFGLPQDDADVYEMIARADTVGVFQLESSGQRNLAMRLKQRDFEDIIAAISLFRPGPMEAQMINPFIRRRHGLEKVEVVHPAMTDALRDTYGVIVYQEQVLRVAEAVAGFDLSEADLLRRMMTKGRSETEMDTMRNHFVARAIECGAEPAVATEVFRQLEGFAAYGFNKAHAACFAVVSYASAWLKHYFPAEFACSILNHEPMGFYSSRTVLNDARRHGVAALPVHVNASGVTFTVEDEGAAIRVGLARVMHMSYSLAPKIVAEREIRPFDDLADFLRRTGADEPAARSLIRIGALDGLGVTDADRPPTRDEMLALLPELKAVLAKEGVHGDATLVIAPGPALDRHESDHVSGWSLARRVSAEMELAGLTISCHPLDLAWNDLERKGVVWARDLHEIADGRRVLVAGVRERAQTPRTRSGKRTCFLTLEDPTGLLDVIVFEEALSRTSETIVRHNVYLVEGMLQNNAERGLAIVAEEIRPYSVRTTAGDPVGLKRGARAGSLGQTRSV